MGEKIEPAVTEEQMDRIVVALLLLRERRLSEAMAKDNDDDFRSIGALPPESEEKV